MNTLYIIGNGFDLYHDIDSKFENFGGYLRKSNPYISSLVESYIIPAKGSVLWSNFEENLANLDMSSIIDEDIPSIKDDDFRPRDIYIFEDKMTFFCQDLTVGLRREFKNWLQSLDISKVKKLLTLDTSSQYLNFNYTNTLPDIYQVPDKNILYIHNNAFDEDIILGHGREPQKYKHEDSFFDEGIENIHRYTELSYKNTKYIILDNKFFFSSLIDVQNIIVMGHSLSDVDMLYFKEIVKNIDVDKVCWHVTYYDLDEEEHHRNILTKELRIPLHRIRLSEMDDFI